MSKTSGVDEQVISLPNGGGAVQPLGATFETDLNTGTGTYSIPIETPAGPNGVQPRLALRYHSAGGNGPFGMGWTLGAMTISRQTDGHLPQYVPDDNRFVLVGVEELIPISATGYRPRVDTMHSRIERKGEGWEVTDSQGALHSLGRTSQSRVEILEDGLIKTASWLLDRIVDTNGNSMTYSYKGDGSQRYLEHIEWGTYRLDFIYEPRPDRITWNRFGFVLTTAIRCSRIELHVTDVAPTLVRSWELGYEQAASSGFSLLSKVALIGHAADGSTIQAPPLTLGYSEFRTPELTRMSELVPGARPGPFASGRVELLDWDGDGLPDMLEMDTGGGRVWPNRGRGRWGVPASIPALPTPVALGEPGIALADMEGNGTADLIMLDRPLGGYYPLKPGGGFDRPVFWRQTPSARLADANSRLVDLDGDGITDMLVTGDNFFSLYYRRGASGWDSRPITIPKSQTPPVKFSDHHIRLADMNGDGLQDLVRIDGGGVTYWPYLGNGKWSAAIEMAKPPALPRQFDPLRLYLADIDGDGCVDVVYVDFGKVIYWFNQGGTGFSEAHEIPFTPGAVPEQVRMADMHGSGTAGVLWSSAAGPTGSSIYFYLAFGGGSKPYLLSRIDNGLGLVSEISYRASTEFELDDAEAGNPWRTFHPFPVMCVSEIGLNDTVTGLNSVTRYRYHECRYDGAARTFLGFSAVDVENVGDDAVAGLLTRNFYHVGLDPQDPNRRLEPEERLKLGALRRRLIRTEVYGLDGSAEQDRPYAVVHHQYDTRLEPALNGDFIAVSFETRTLEEQYERGAAPFAFTQIDYLNLDEHGNVTKQKKKVWRTGQPAADQEVVTDITFAKNTTANILSLPARVTQTEAGQRLSVTITFYDGPAHQGLPEGQTTAGNVTRKEALVLTDELVQSVYGANQPDWTTLGYHRIAGESGWWITQYSYEVQDTPAGLALITRGPRGFDTRLEYDSTKQFPSKLVDALGNSMQGTADERVFQMRAHVDFNGQKAMDVFDALGRVTRTVNPFDSDALPTASYQYRSASLPLRVSTFMRETTGAPGTLDQYRYYDGHARLLQAIVEGEGDAGRRFIVQESKEYTTRGQIKARYAPYYVDTIEYAPPGPGSVKMTARYDGLGRLIEQTKASGSKRKQSYAPGRIETLDEANSSSPNPAILVNLLDGLKRTVAVENHLSDRVIRATYEYDAMSHLLRVVQPDSGESTYVYDLLGRTLVETSPDTGRTVFVIDASGNQIRRNTSNGKSIVNKYDSLDRLIEVRQDGAAAPEMTYHYLDQGSPAPPDGIQNRLGRVWQVQDQVGLMTYRYDAVGRVTQAIRTVNALAGKSLVTDFVYDDLGRETRVTLPEPAPGAGRRIVDYHYNARGLTDASPSYVRSAEYDVQGHCTRLVYQNGVENLLDFDLVTGRPSRLRVRKQDGTILRDQTFSFDQVGNITGIASPLAVEAGQFKYDQMYRLTEASYGTGEHFAYQYSDGGNITHIDGLGDLTYGIPHSGAVTSAGGANYAYDADGFLQQAPYGSLQFDALDNLTNIKLNDGRSIDYVYDFQGQRAIRSLTGGSLSVFADPHIEFHDGKAVVWVMFARKRILAITDSGSAFIHSDPIGNPTLYTGVDGAEVRRLAFGPYGTIRFDSAAGAGLPDGARFAGQTLDAEIGLICMGRRFYDPRLGRFISPDRVVPGVFQLDSWNRYCYAHNNPLRYTDPTGHLSLGDIFAIIGIAIVVAVLIVAGIFTCGATWAVAGVVINVSGLLIGTAIGVAAGAVLGGISAGMQGGDIWAGVLLGGFVGGVTAFGGGVLGAMAGSFAGSLFSSQIGFYVAGGVGGAIQGTLIGAGTGFAIGFAGGKGTAESIWTHMWKGALIGAITGAALGILSAYIFATPNATLQVGTLAKVSPVAAAAGSVTDQISYLDTAAGIGQDIGEAATGTGTGVGILGSFVNVGSGPGAALLNIPIGWVPDVLLNYGGIAFASDTMIGLDTYTKFTFERVLILVAEAAPYFVGVFLTFADDGHWGWFDDMKSSLHNVFAMPETPSS